MKGRKAQSPSPPNVLSAPPRASAVQPTPWWRRPAILAAALLALGLVAYAPVTRDKFIWDDDFYVTHNPTLRSLSGLWAMWFVPKSLPQYYPLVHSTFWVEYHLWELNPLGYHITNVLLHATSAILFWRLLVRLRVPGAWIAAALFAVHPVTVESVAWITERKNVLSLVLALSSLLCYLRFAPAQEFEAETEAPTRRWGWYVLALVLFLGALLSKTVVASLPAVLLVIYWWQRGRLTLRDVAPLVPFFILGASLGIITAVLERYHVGAEGEEWAFTIIERLLIAGRAVWFYAAKLMWPHPMMFFYVRWDVDSAQAWQMMFPLAAAALIASLWLARERVGRGPLAAALIFGGVLFPALGFFNVYPFRYSFVADHFQYHASLALFALTGAGAAGAVNRLRATERTIAQIAIFATLAALALVTAGQTRVYYDLESLYRDTIEKNPRSVFAYSNLALVLSGWNRSSEAMEMGRQAVSVAPREAGVRSNLGAILLGVYKDDLTRTELLDEAVAELSKAIELNPNYSQAHSNIALAMIVTDQDDKAMHHLTRALEINPYDAKTLYGMATLQAKLQHGTEAEDYYRRALERDPDYADAHYGLGLELSNQGKVDEAIAHWQAGLRVNPAHADAHYALAEALSARGDLRAAAQQYVAAVRARPTYQAALVKAGVTLLNLGDAAAALPYFEKALAQISNDADAHFGIAIVLVRLGRGAEALQHLQRSLEVDANRPEAHFELANLLAANQKFAEAASEYAAAVRLRPQYFDALENLGAALLALGDVERAIPHLEAALQLQPGNPQAKSNLDHALRLREHGSGK